MASYKIIDDQHARVGLWMQKRGGGEYRDGAKCIGLERGAELVSGALFDGCNGASVYAHIVVERANREFLWFICYYPFVQLGVNVIIGVVSEDNRKARRFDEHFGFRLAARLPRADPSGDLLIYTLHKEHCRWLNGKTQRTQNA